MKNRLFRCSALVATVLSFALLGCDQPPAIRQYTIPTEVPAALRSQDRMLVAMVPQDDQVWFFKVVGPAQAVDQAEDELRDFFQQVQFADGKPDLQSLPPGWKRAAEKPMRFATVMVPTASAELELAISQLPKTGQWDDVVVMNVNRWRGQMKLSASQDHWAGAQPLRTDDSASEPAVWVDLSGEMGGGPSMGAAPFASGAALPAGHPEVPPADSPSGGASSDAQAGPPGEPAPDSATTPAGRGAAANDSATRPATDSAGGAASADAPAGLKYDAPQDWRPGKMSVMRLAAFEFGPEDKPAQLTIIQAGGDLRSNVNRWLGEVRGGSPPGEVVDEALAQAENLRVSGREAQRFYLGDGKEGSPDAQAIDATIVQLGDGMSLFIKATGPAETLVQQREAIGQFLESLSLPQ